MLNKHYLEELRSYLGLVLLQKDNEYCIIQDSLDNNTVKGILFQNKHIINSVRLENSVDDWVYYCYDRPRQFIGLLRTEPVILDITTFNKLLNSILIYEFKQLIVTSNYLTQITGINDNGLIFKLEKPRKWRINGQLRVLKRSLSFKLPIKSGLYTYDCIDSSNYMHFIPSKKG